MFPHALERRVRLREVTDAVANGRSLTLEVVGHLALRRTALAAARVTRRFRRCQKSFWDSDGAAGKRLVVVALPRALERRVGLREVAVLSPS